MQMSTSEPWQSVPTPEWTAAAGGGVVRTHHGTSRTWMIMDALTVVCAVLLATLIPLHIDSVSGLKQFWQGTLVPGASASVLLMLLSGFIACLIVTSHQLNLYSPGRIYGFLHEQRLTVQACFISQLLLTGTLYFLHSVVIPRRVILVTFLLVVLALTLRRLTHRVLLYRQFDRGMGTRNVLIVGTGLEAHALRHHLQNRHLGYTFKGFIDTSSSSSQRVVPTAEIVGSLDSLFNHTRKNFVDEVFFTTRIEDRALRSILLKAREQSIDLRIVPDMYDGLAWNSPIEFIGQFPTIHLHRGQVPEIALVLKRVLDIAVSLFAITALAPVLLAIAISVRLDSPGPILYRSERIGKKGRVFKCTKFRTMVRDAEARRADLMHLNERDGVLFKLVNDPRVTAVGRLLRKYSLDELPQFFNVLAGDMSVVGPRPPIASEVREYQLSHLRRLDVMPGITGLWQVQGRRDPSFESYISLDFTYIENWSLWLDIKIILRTVAVVFAGTGS